jgi:hypothetical protein
MNLGTGDPDGAARILHYCLDKTTYVWEVGQFIVFPASQPSSRSNPEASVAGAQKRINSRGRQPLADRSGPQHKVHAVEAH